MFLPPSYSVSPKHNHTIVFQSSPGRPRGSRHSASVCIRVHPWPNRLFSLTFGQLLKVGFGPRMDTDTHAAPTKKKAAPPFGEARLRVVNRVKLSSPCP